MSDRNRNLITACDSFVSVLVEKSDCPVYSDGDNQRREVSGRELFSQLKKSDIDDADLYRSLVCTGTPCGGEIDGYCGVSVASVGCAAVLGRNDWLGGDCRIDGVGGIGRVGELVFYTSGFTENPVRRGERRLGFRVFIELVVPEEDVNPLNAASCIDLIEAGKGA